MIKMFSQCLLLILLVFTQVEAAGKASKDLKGMEDRLIAMVNQERSRHGLKKLKTWHALSDCARGHSRNMAKESVAFGHGGFEERTAMIKKYGGMRAFGENVAYCYLMDDPLQVAVTQWMESPGHRRNILDDYAETGIGIACDEKGGYYMTQLFCRRAQ